MATKKLTKGWIPNYHGAWAMISIPVILGIILSGFRAEHILLLAFWWLGYFAYFAISQWLHFRYDRQYLPPAKFYFILLIPLGLTLAMVAPYLLWWFLLYIPLIAIGIWAAKTRQDRHFLNDAAAVIAASLTLPIAFDLGTSGAKFAIFSNSSLFGLSWFFTHLEEGQKALKFKWIIVWTWTLFIGAYFLGTVLYVKTLIRNRKSDFYLIASILYHLIFLFLAIVFWNLNKVSLTLSFLWVILTSRAVFFPLYGRYKIWVSIKKIGMLELGFSILAFLSLINSSGYSL